MHVMSATVKIHCRDYTDSDVVVSCRVYLFLLKVIKVTEFFISLVTQMSPITKFRRAIISLYYVNTDSSVISWLILQSLNNYCFITILLYHHFVSASSLLRHTCNTLKIECRQLTSQVSTDGRWT